MPDEPVEITKSDKIVSVMLNDPDRRNALTIDMFDALDAVLDDTAGDAGTHVLLLHGAGRMFCAGFDLDAAAAEPKLMGRFIIRLSRVNRSLRRLPQVVVVAVRGAALAGGCAMVSACDFVVASATAKFGYPVHALGVSPAVTTATLAQSIGDGPARALLLGGQLLSGAEAHRRGLVSLLSASDDDVPNDARELCRALAAKPPHALRTTKAWLNELDGSRDESRFEGPAKATAALADTEEAFGILREGWEARRRSR
jgi:enoyl-CoA hydratase/carnithine racemase